MTLLLIIVQIYYNIILLVPIYIFFKKHWVEEKLKAPWFRYDKILISKQIWLSCKQLVTRVTLQLTQCIISHIVSLIVFQLCKFKPSHVNSNLLLPLDQPWLELSRVFAFPLLCLTVQLPVLFSFAPPEKENLLKHFLKNNTKRDLQVQSI